MMTIKEAKERGFKACMEAIGYEFCKHHADNGTSAYSETEGIVYCFVGISDEPASECDIVQVDRLVLTSKKDWPYAASCNVYMNDGRVEMLDVRRPNH